MPISIKREKSYNILKSHHLEKTTVNISIYIPEGPPVLSFRDTSVELTGFIDRLFLAGICCWEGFGEFADQDPGNFAQGSWTLHGTRPGPKSGHNIFSKNHKTSD